MIFSMVSMISMANPPINGAIYAVTVAKTSNSFSVPAVFDSGYQHVFNPDLRCVALGLPRFLLRAHAWGLGT